MPQRLLGLVCVLAAAGTACGSDARLQAQAGEDLAHLEHTRRELRALEALLDETEARLFRGREVVALWKELGARHQSVSELACRNTAMHVEQMDAIEQKHRRSREILARRRVAEAPGRATNEATVQAVKVPAAASAAPKRLAP